MIRKIFIKTIDFTIDNLEKTKLKIKKIDKQKLKMKGPYKMKPNQLMNLFLYQNHSIYLAFLLPYHQKHLKQKRLILNNKLYLYNV